MTGRSLALVANFHRERRIGRKTANFLRHVGEHLRGRGIQFNIEFVLDRPDSVTVDCIEQSAAVIPQARIHIVDFGNLGVSRTFGVENARADVVCFTDGDDFFSIDWFEGALDYFSSGLRKEVLHTQYMVGFDHEEFIRETTESTDPSFDPLSLAVDWYWSANLAVQAEVFALAPIEPYDHAAGFGSEDWHWTCNSLAHGIARVSLPGATYYYRVKPERFALGRVADVIHLPSPLFAAGRLPAPPRSPLVAPPVPTPLAADFFAQARQVEPFELGVSYLRAVEAGAREVRHFKPHTPPLIGSVYRAAHQAGFGDGCAVVFADLQRLTGGVETAAALCTALTDAPSAGRLYIVDGPQEPSAERQDGFVISLGELRSANVYAIQIDRLIARFMIQHRGLTVVNLISSRMASRSLAFCRATRGGVGRWVNVVTDYGFDCLSQAYDELAAYRAAGLESEDVAIFEKTAVEAWRLRGVVLTHDPELEHAFVARPMAMPPGGARPALLARDAMESGHSSPIEVNVFRVRAEDLALTREGLAQGPWLRVTDRLLDIASRASECILVCGDAVLGAGFGGEDRQGLVGLRIPALTIVHRERQPTSYVRHSLEIWNRELKLGCAPADLVVAGAIGVDCLSVLDLLGDRPDWISLPVLLALSIRRARRAGGTSVGLFSTDSVVSADIEQLRGLGGPLLLRGLTSELSSDDSNG